MASEFPKFHDGDVAIVIDPGKTYQLHSSVLQRNSPFFANLFSAEGPAQLSSAAVKQGVTTRYRFELFKVSSDAVGTFIRRVGSLLE